MQSFWFVFRSKWLKQKKIVESVISVIRILLGQLSQILDHLIYILLKITGTSYLFRFLEFLKKHSVIHKSQYN